MISRQGDGFVSVLCEFDGHTLTVAECGTGPRMPTSSRWRGVPLLKWAHVAMTTLTVIPVSQVPLLTNREMKRVSRNRCVIHTS